jgi:hypothetical protein
MRLPFRLFAVRHQAWLATAKLHPFTGGNMAAEFRSTMEARVIERALKDESFRQQLVDDPHAALQQVLGVSLPGSVNIEVLEETPGTMYLVLPPAESGSRELSEQEVASVAGGGITWSSASNSCSC